MRRLGDDGKRDFDELVGADDLDAAEEARLRRVHDLLVQAGPPPELSPSLERPPTHEQRQADILPFPRTARRRARAYGLLAAAAAAAVFGAGFLFGHSKAGPAAFSATRVVAMHGAADAHATIRIGKADSVGNWPMLVTVVGLPQQPTHAAYYELWLSRNGKPVAPCGGFRVHGETTTIRLTVPYRLHRFDGWIVTASEPGAPEPGKVVMTT